MDLSERKRRILRAVVDNYIETAEPVGSKTIVERAALDVSPATIRNEMADLESMGLLEQPHTSAGRIPSARGYRIYVNELMAGHKLSLEETQSINQGLRLKMQELDQVISDAGRVLSQLTHYPVFARGAAATRTTIRRFELLMMEQGAVIAVLVTSLNVVKNKLLRYPGEVGTAQLQLLGAVLNESFTGLTCDEFTPERMRMAAQAAGGAGAILSLVVSFALEVLEEQERQAVYMAGTTHLLQQPEYQDVGKARQLLDYLSDDKELARIPQPQPDQGMQILIGPENVAEQLRDTSVIMASYDIGDNMRGLIGVVGPTRMDYAKVAARLSYFADGMSRLFGNGQQIPPFSGRTEENE